MRFDLVVAGGTVLDPDTFDLPATMTKFLALDLSLEETVRRAAREPGRRLWADPEARPQGKRKPGLPLLDARLTRPAATPTA